MYDENYDEHIPYESLFKFMNKLGINYFFVSLNEQVKIMVEEFQKIFEKSIKELFEQK